MQRGVAEMTAELTMRVTSQRGCRAWAQWRSAGRLRVEGGGGVPRSLVLCGSRHTVRRGRRAGVRREGCSGVRARRWAARHGAGGSARSRHGADVSRVRCERERGSRGGRVWRAAAGMRSSCCSGMAAFQGLLVRV